MSLPAMLGPTRGPVTQELSGDLQRWRAAALGGLGAVSAWSTSLSLLLHLVPVWASPPCPPRAPAGPGPQAMVRLSSAPSGCPGGACGTSEGPEAAELQPAVHRHQDPAPPPPPLMGPQICRLRKGGGLAHAHSPHSCLPRADTAHAPLSRASPASPSATDQCHQPSGSPHLLQVASLLLPVLAKEAAVEEWGWGLARAGKRTTCLGMGGSGCCWRSATIRPG